MDLQEMNVIVTGAASGMGKYFALALARDGANVMACDVDEEGLAELADEAEGTVATQVCDVSREHDVVALIEATADAFGSANGLVNNAGIFRDALLVKKDRDTGQVTKMSIDDWQSVIDVDLTGPFLCTREVAAHLVETGEEGVIVNISSVSRHGNRGQGNYSAAKAGLVADTKLWGEELSRYGIRVGAVAPGFIDTPILQGMPERMLEKMVSQIPLGRVGDPHEIYQGVKFIFECDYFTGRCLDIDGGVTV